MLGLTVRRADNSKIGRVKSQTAPLLQEDNKTKNINEVFVLRRDEAFATSVSCCTINHYARKRRTRV